jgi:hypothetical protein
LPWVFRSTAFGNSPFLRKTGYDGNDKIDFMEEDYMPIEGHVLASCITAENPDEGFASSGIERIKFQSTSNVGDTLVPARMVEFTSSPTVVWSLFAKGANRTSASPDPRAQGD